MRELLIAAAFLVVVVYFAAFYDNPPVSEMIASNPCRQAHTFPNDCLLIANVMGPAK
jgi:hypothetical protein